MEIAVQREGTTVTVKAGGRIDGVNARDFENQLRETIEDGDKGVVVDLEGLSYISSAGLRAILLIAKTLSQRGAKFALCALSEPIREVFEISGFDKIVAIHNTQREALAAVT